MGFRSGWITDLVIVDGHLEERVEHGGYASAISWVIAYVLSGKAGNGARYLITGAELPIHLRGIADLLKRAITPHREGGRYSLFRP